MKVKKFPQSHLVITNDLGKKLIIDPGYLTFDPSTGSGWKVSDFQGADVYLITHIHDDHMGWNTIKEVVGSKPVFGNFDVVNKLKELGVEGKLVEDRKTFNQDGFEITPIDLPHFEIPSGRPIPQNTGFVIDGIFFHAGDGFEFKGLTVENAAIAIGHPALSYLGVMKFAKDLGVKVLIPIHYDKYLRNPEELKLTSEVYKFGIEIRTLNVGEETTV